MRALRRRSGPRRRSARRGRARSRRRERPWARRGPAAAGRSRMKPRASASFCHWPKDTSTPPGQVGPSCVSRPEAKARDDVVGARRARRPSRTARSSSSRGTSPRPTVWRARNSKRKKSWKAPDSRSRHVVRRHAGERRVVHEDGARRGLVHLGEQLDERRLARAVLAHDGDDRPRGQRQRHVVEDEPRRAGVGERDVLEANALAQNGGRGQVGATRSMDAA